MLLILELHLCFQVGCSRLGGRIFFSKEEPVLNSMDMSTASRNGNRSGESDRIACLIRSYRKLRITVVDSVS